MGLEAGSTRCFCGSQRLLAQCCEPLLLGQAIAPTAETLMRSRYSAYCVGNVDYLVATHHPLYRARDMRSQISQTMQSTEWLGLVIVETEGGQPQDATGVVEFVAVYRAGSEAQLHERSRFVQQKGRWLYQDGDVLPPLWPKRNEPCWCGSGQKFKQCHGGRGRSPG